MNEKERNFVANLVEHLDEKKKKQKNDRKKSHIQVNARKCNLQAEYLIECPFKLTL